MHGRTDRRLPSKDDARRCGRGRMPLASAARPRPRGRGVSRVLRRCRAARDCNGRRAMAGHRHGQDAGRRGATPTVLPRGLPGRSPRGVHRAAVGRSSGSGHDAVRHLLAVASQAVLPSAKTAVVSHTAAGQRRHLTGFPFQPTREGRHRRPQDIGFLCLVNTKCGAGLPGACGARVCATWPRWWHGGCGVGAWEGVGLVRARLMRGARPAIGRRVMP